MSENWPYVGIGSRKAPPKILNIAAQIAYVLAKKGYTLRSGAAAGMDEAFERGCVAAEGNKRIFIPWEGFNDHWVSAHKGIFTVSPGRAYTIAEEYHPSYRKLKPSVKNLMARNSHQVLGFDCATPATFVICWTPDGSLDGQGPDTGGTGQALRISTAYGIPVFNMQRENHLAKMLKYLEEFRKKGGTIPDFY